MASTLPFNIRIFVAEGIPDGLRLVEKSGWVGQGVVCPRGRYPRMKDRKEFLRSGVYFLIGHEDDDLPTIYIGEAEKVQDRLNQHYANKDFWQQVIVFTSMEGNPLNKAEVQYLEACLVELAKKHNRCRLDNSNTPKRPGLSEADEAEVRGYLIELLSLLPVLGIDVFMPAEIASSDQHIFYLKAKGCEASGFETNTGFTVRKGSLARGDASPTLKKFGPGCYRKRQRLIDESILAQEVDGYRFTENHAFNSPSQAASLCLGRHIGGLKKWKDRKGVSLKQHREKGQA